MIVGSFIWGGSKTKSKKKEASEGAIDSERQTAADNPDALTGIPPAQNLSPTSSMGVWPGSRGVEMRNVHADIDLMRG